VAGSQFPVFPAEPGISSIFLAQPPFGRADGKSNQALAGEFPEQSELGIRAGPTGN
jgi:hypothetical protein